MTQKTLAILSLSAVLFLSQTLLINGSAADDNKLSDVRVASTFITDGMPYAAFDELPATSFKVSGGTVEVAFAPGKLELAHEKIIDWIAASAHATVNYYAGLPVRKVRVLIIPGSGKGIRSGVSYGYGGAAIKVTVGRFTTQTDLDKDWVMTHEMVHLTFPSMPDAHRWIQEGIATYVEPIARAQVDQLSAEKVWADMVKGLPQGLPEAGDRGLDHTPTWGRTYWGGALFCLLADIEIRRRTDNRKGLQDALRAIAAAGGTIEVRSTLAHAFETGDEATGVPVLTELYERMKATPVAIDLPELWQRLGVEIYNGIVTFHEDAPFASVRRAIISDEQTTDKIS